MPGEIEFDLTKTISPRFCFPLWLATQLDVNTRQQFTDAERLGDVIVRADFQPDDLVNLLAARGQHNDGGVHPFAPQLAAHIQPAQAGQHDVEQNQIGPFLTGEARAFLAVPRDNYFAALYFEVVAQPQRQIRLVFNDEDSRQRCILLCYWLRYWLRYWHRY